MFFYTTLMLMEVLCIYRGRPHIILYTILMSMESTLTLMSIDKRMILRGLFEQLECKEMMILDFHVGCLTLKQSWAQGH